MSTGGIAECLGRACERGGIRVGFFAVCALIWCLPLVSTVDSLNEFRDAHVLLHYEEVAARTVREHGEAPLWNPYYCGGTHLLGSPQTRHAAPTFLLSLLFGAQRALPLTAFLMLVLGMEGFFRYVRNRTIGAFGPALMAPLFAGNGLFASSFFMGWINFFGFQLMPWVLFGVTRAVRGDRRALLAIALGTAFIVGFGGTYAAPMTALFATFELGRAVIEEGPSRRSTWRGVGLALLGAFLGAALCAVRLWPIAETLAHAPRIMAGAPRHTLSDLASMAFDLSEPAHGNPRLPGILFLGGFAASGGLFGILAGRRAIYPLMLAILSVATAMGYAIPNGPFILLRELPLFDGLRYPFRFLFPAALFVLELGALGADVLLAALTRRRLAALPLLLLVGLSIAGFVQQRINVERTVAGMPLERMPQERDEPFRQARGSRRALLHYTAQGLGSLSCWEAYPVPMSPLLRGDLSAEERLDDPGAGTVRRTSWSPNRIDLEVSADRPARLLINQNWHPGWRASVGTVVSTDGLLSVELPSGRHSVTLRFLPRSAIGGGLIGLGGLLALFLALRRRLDAKRIAVILASPMLLGIFALAIDEPAWPRPALTNANGEPIVLNALPPEAIPLDVQFALPVRLVGYEPPHVVDADGAWTIRLYFEVTGSVPRSVGVFVHVIDSDGRAVTADHEVIGASLFLGRAPRGAILRDAFSIAPGGPGLHRLHVGLWHASGDGTRVPVADAGALEVIDHRVEVGAFDAPVRGRGGR